MKTKNVIKRSNLPTNSPIISGLVLYLVLDKWNAPGWIWGAVGLLYLIILINWIVETIRQKEVDILQSDFRNKINDSLSDLEKILKNKNEHSNN